MEVGDEVVSLKCPLSLVRMKYPGKSKRCRHRQCFDIQMYVEANEKLMVPKCPVCRVDAPVKDLYLDRQYRHYLVTFPKSTECIVRADNSVISADSEQNSDAASIFDEDGGDNNVSVDRGKKRRWSDHHSTPGQQPSIIILDDEEEATEVAGTTMRTEMVDDAEARVKERPRKMAKEERGQSQIPIGNDALSQEMYAALGDLSPNQPAVTSPSSFSPHPSNQTHTQAAPGSDWDNAIALD